MNEARMTLIATLCAAASVVATAFFWRETYLLIGVLLTLGIVMALIERHPSAYLIYFFGFLLGPLCESLPILFGAWSYANPHFFGFSWWLPFLWGNAGLFIHRINLQVRSVLE